MDEVGPPRDGVLVNALDQFFKALDAYTLADLVRMKGSRRLSDFLPVQGARGFGIYLLDRIAPLRRAVMREGVEPAAQPRLMRGEAL